MANTYTQIYIHIIFAVSGHQNHIPKVHCETINRYISGIIKNRNHKLMAINIMPDHCHILVGLKPDGALSELVRDIKAVSSKFINEQRLVLGKFSWQEGYAAFSYSQSQVKDVIEYIRNQEKHHSRKSFQNEYIDFLKKYNIEYNPKYIFEID
jgi:REP element-mobilizing transposase RayT